MTDTTTTEPLLSLSAIKARNRSAGYHFFDPDTMRFFHSRVSEPVYPMPDGSALFITSERNYGHSLYGESYDYGRKYTIRVANPGGDTDTVGEFQQYPSLRSAHAAARRLSSHA